MAKGHQHGANCYHVYPMMTREGVHVGFTPEVGSEEQAADWVDFESDHEFLDLTETPGEEPGWVIVVGG